MVDPYTLAAVKYHGAPPGWKAWSLFAEVAMWRGHTVVCVTARRGKFLEDRQQVVEALPQCVAAYFAYDTPKRTFMAQQGIEVDIWIDDSPETI